MRVLVTGANGFLASNVVRELNRRGMQVRSMVRRSADLRSLSAVDSELYYGNITNILDALEATKGCDVIIHVAADTSQHHTDYEPYMRVNFSGTFNMLEAAVRNNVRRFVFVSTANAFGHGTKSDPGNEQTTARYPFTESGYAISKTKAQELVLEYVNSGRLEAVVVNPTFMIGPYDLKPGSGKIITMMYNRRFVPVPPGGKNFIHVADAACGICNAINMGESGSCYLLANENLSYSEFYTKLGNIRGKAYNQIKLPTGIMNTLGMVGSLIAKTGIRYELHRTNARLLCAGNYYSGEKAVAALQLPQTPVEVAIRDALEWFFRIGYLKK